MAYFDNAATTFPKPDCVYDYMNEFYRKHGANAGRGSYSMAKSAGAILQDTRLRLQRLLHCDAKQVIFTPTATIALNIVIQGLLKKGLRNVYISPFEHNAVTRTLHHYAKQGLINVQQLVVARDLTYDLERIRYQFEAVKPDLVIVSHASNVIGLVAPVSEIFLLAKQHNAFTVADMSQTAGLVDVDAGQECFDFAVFAGHKTLYGPTGISGFVMKPQIELEPLLLGGTGLESANQDLPKSLPERYEAGTGNILGVAGLNAALRWLEKVGIEQLWQQEQQHRRRLLALLRSYSFIQIIGDSEAASFAGIVSCVIAGISSDSAAEIFSQQGIAVRTGLHCAPLAHQFLGTFPAGTIRFSVSWFTSDRDFAELEAALDYIEENL